MEVGAKPGRSHRRSALQMRSGRGSGLLSRLGGYCQVDMRTHPSTFEDAGAARRRHVRCRHEQGLISPKVLKSISVQIRQLIPYMSNDNG